MLSISKFYGQFLQTYKVYIYILPRPVNNTGSASKFCFSRSSVYACFARDNTKLTRQCTMCRKFL